MSMKVSNVSCFLLGPTPAESLAKADQRFQSRELVFHGLIAGGIQRPLRFQQRQKIAGTGLIAQSRTFECALTLLKILDLKFAGDIQVMNRGQCIFDIDERGDDGGPISREQLQLLGLHFITLCS